MKLSFLAIAAAAGLASCQCVSMIPECAQSCLTIAAGSVGCGETDYACQCTQDHQTDITSNATTCVLAACGQQVALNEVLPAASAFCSAINAGKSCTSASATASSSGSTSFSVSLLPTTDSTTATGSDATATTGSPSSASQTATTTDSSGTGTATGASATASSAGGAASMGSVGSLGIAVLGALVML